MVIGKELSHYKIIADLGRGGMGEVYLARDLLLNREVAIKILPKSLMQTDPNSHQRFVQEAKATAALDHPYIATIFEIGEEHGITFIAMELIRGEELADLLEKGPLGVEQTLNFATEIVEGLAFAHEKGIVHRDLKPSNVMVKSGGLHIKIIDFGLAKLTQPLPELDEEETAERAYSRAGEVKGTLAYMSPEQARGQDLDHRSDIFSFGVLLHQMLTGVHPFQRESALERVHAIINSPASRLAETLDADVAKRLQPIVDRCLEKDQKDRFQETRDLLEALKEARAHIESSAYLLAADKPKSYRQWLAVPLTLGVAALAAVVYGVFDRTTTVAVLPWGHDGLAESAHLGQLVSLALNDRLKNFTALEVTPFSTSRTYGPDEDPVLVADQLGVDWIVQGHLTTSADQIVANVNLVGPDGNAKGWPQEIVLDPSEVIALSERVASSLADALGVAESATKRRADPKALEHYLEGRTHLLGWDVERNENLAEESFRKSLEFDENFAEAHAGLAQALWRRYGRSREPGLVEESFNEAQQAVMLAPQLAEAHLALGVVLLGRGRGVEASASFNKALELAPADDAATLWIADAYAELGQEDEAEAMYQRAIDLRPGHWQNYVSKAGFYLFRATAKLEEAKLLYQQVIRLRPDSDVGYHGLAAAHLIAGAFSAAEPLLQAAIRINPSGNAHNDLGVVYYALGRFELALEQFRLAVEMRPDAVHWIGLADTFRQLEKREEAAESYTRAVQLLHEQLEINPTDAQARGYLSQGLAALGQCDVARTEASQAAPADGQLPYVDYLVAVTHSLCGDQEKVLHHTKRALLGGVKVDVGTSPDLKPFLDDPSLKEALSATESPSQ
ncbi:MAG: serine/threonine-protein kinase [Acidobacteria bacterium]|nr:MAG: serine/threonine-protein kinase [Acidobacteriota bacterium]